MQKKKMVTQNPNEGMEGWHWSDGSNKLKKKKNSSCIWLKNISYTAYG